MQEWGRPPAGWDAFEARFCNRNSGHEKGGVEGLVGFARRNYMVPIPEAESLSALNEAILNRCITYGSHKIQGRSQTVSELYEEEKSKLVPLPDIIFSNVQTYDSRVDKYATVIVDRNRYSVPTQYVGIKAKIPLTMDQVKIFWGGKNLATHDRFYGSNKWELSPEHYLELLQTRPMAFDSARPILGWQKTWPESLERLLTRFRTAQGESSGTKYFISVLLLYKEYPADEFEAAVISVLKSGISTSEGVRHILIRENETPMMSKPLAGWQSLSPSDVSVYGQLGGGK